MKNELMIETTINTPNGNENHIQFQSIPSFNACHKLSQSKSLYIHHRINPPNKSGRTILNTLRSIFVLSKWLTLRF